MKKSYPISEEESIDVACEPVATAMVTVPKSVNGITTVHDELDDLDWDRFPSYGPFSDEEAIARIEEAEKDLGDPSKWITSEQMWERLYSKFPWLR